MAQCPKCHYIRTEADAHIPDGVCPACGIAYAKWLAAQQNETAAMADEGYDEAIEPDESDTPHTLGEKVRFWLFYIPDRIDPLVFWSRVAAYLLFFI